MKKNQGAKHKTSSGPKVELIRLEDLVEILEADQLRHVTGGNLLPRPREDVGG